MFAKSEQHSGHRLATWIKDVANAGGTGGLNWHVHAARSLSRWLPTREALAQFLSKTPITHSHLVLIGCSAGWMLPTPWLAKFERIEVYDIDPLVPWLFGLRHGRWLKAQGIQIQHHRQDAIAGLPGLLKQHPQACVWFDNVLGQLGVRLGDEDMAEKQLNQLKQVLQGRSWGSVHDLYSGAIDTTMALPAYKNTSWVRMNDGPEETTRIQLGDTVLPHAEAAQQLLARLNAMGVWHDHATQSVFPVGTECTLMPWAFKPAYWHWLQAAWVTP